MHRAPATAPRRLRENRRRYDLAVEVVRRRAAAGDLEGVLRAATVAAQFAWWAPTGLVNDPELERLVIDAARGGLGSARVVPSPPGRRVLHVLSEAYGIGGHTRLAWRWLERDPRPADVALTNQHSPLPEPLRRAVEAAGGTVHDLRAGAPALVDRASALRRLMDEAEVVVHHVHPYDAVALAAANLPGPRPPIVFENHADHTFWLGLGSADVLSDYRPAGQEFSTTVRGVPARRSAVLPLPVDARSTSAGRDQLRARLGVRDREVLAVSVASPVKMEPVWGTGFADLLAGVLAAHPALKVVLVGPGQQGRWAQLAARFPGRLVAVGTVADPETFLAAADLYLDSYPLPSLTSVLEAAMAGLPVLSLLDLGARHGRAQLFQAGSPGQQVPGQSAGTEDQYRAQLRRLVRDPALRAERGAAARAAATAAHTGPGWSTQLEELYALAATVPAADLDEHPAPVVDLDFAAMLVAFAPAGDSTPELETMAAPLGEQFDAALSADLFAVTHRDDPAPISVRGPADWPDHPAWTARLLALATAHPRLRVSLPFAPGDDATGALSVQHLTALLSGNGDTPDDCGDVNLEDRVPAGGAPAAPMPPTEDALAHLAGLLASPCWQADQARVPAAAPA